MQIGGLKVKTMAALRHGISTVIIPQDNLQDLQEIDQTVKNALNFVAAKSIDTVLDVALVRSEVTEENVIKEIPHERNHRNHKPVIRQ